MWKQAPRRRVRRCGSMSTKKNSLVVATVRIGWFPVIVVFPLRCFAEVIEGYADILCLFRPVSKKVWAGITFLENLVALIRDYGPLDLADIDVASPEGKVRIRFLLR